MSTESAGIVYLVGAGPGDAGLITLRAVECLRRADVVVYDNLANGELLRYAPASAEKVYAGKKADQHTKTQDEIHELLARHALHGKVVVRLKGGDPFLFGRGGEEAAWLTGRGIRWEVVPGVTSAIAVPAYAGIPVTHRCVNGSVHIVTGHENVEGLGADIDWPVLARSRGTIVMLMGIKNLPVVVENLIRYGMSGDTPAALIQWGTRSEQRTVVSKLSCLADDGNAAGIRPPAITVIGEVVRLRETLAWVEKRPLFGMRVAVTRPLDENDDLASRLEDLGAEVVRTPAMRLVPLNADETAVLTMKNLAGGTGGWLVFTSGNGVREFFRMWMGGGYDSRTLATLKLAAIGTRTADALADYGLLADLVSADARQEALADDLLLRGAKDVTIARARVARPVLENALHSAGVAVRVLPVYETLPDAEGIERLRALLADGKLQAVTFTSARTFEEFAANCGEGLVDLLAGVAVAVIGSVTRAAVEKAGVSVAAQADSANMHSLAESLAVWRRSV